MTTTQDKNALSSEAPLAPVTVERNVRSDLDTTLPKAYIHTLVFYLPINHKPTENVDLDNVEQASLNTQLSSSNIGFRLLQKMGWKGKGLGKEEQGIIEPIRSGMRDAKLGVRKQEEDDFYTAKENIQRKKLDVELEETEEIAKKREISNSSSTKKKAKIPIASVFGNDSDKEQ
ncbi:septin and tuftelin-interacting protein 1 homolog 2-like [Impatiens glandulifera]|uniref:septin and tuftelin-interacting protein 1 homolog 2-like n=1 Tax=Impatiens glandulifera TaxID=253017 RepID=UPI001FB1239C|nr:septin and tuftelin-interacting protein 1 homolog 2-like [Impatiens glandulifera]